MTHSNLMIRSNVYLRDPAKPITEDLAFLNQVRGIEAIKKVLKWFYVPPHQQRHDSQVVLDLLKQKKLTSSQQLALKWSIRCSECNSIPCGLTFKGTMEYRCRVPDCTANPINRKKNRTQQVKVKHKY